MKNYLKETKEAYLAYKDTRKKEGPANKEKPEIRAIDQLIYDICMIWHFNIIIPALMILTLLQILKLYFVEILALSLIAYMIYEHYNQPDPVVNHNGQYLWLMDFLYGPARSMHEYLPVTKLQVVSDLSSPTKYELVNGCTFYHYQLTKTSCEDIDTDKINFATKILQANLIKKMDAYEHHHNNNGDTFYKDTRVIIVDEIYDAGTHCIIKILWINNDDAYHYWINKNTPKKGKLNDIDDEDF